MNLSPFPGVEFGLPLSPGLEFVLPGPAPVPLAACSSRIFRERAVVPLGREMMYFPSISAVTRRRLAPTEGAAGPAGAVPGERDGDGSGDGERLLSLPDPPGAAPDLP